MNGETAVLAETRDEDISIRMCAGCRQKEARDALVRFAVRHGDLAPDIHGRLGGRGVSIHPRRGCFETAVRRGGLARVLGGPVPRPADELARTAAEQYRRRAEGLLQGARRAKAVAVGTDAVRESIENQRLALLVVATDAENRREELERAAGRLGRRCVVFGTRTYLGRLWGREEVAVLSILDAKIADELSRTVERVTALSEVA